ncbi:nucleotide sugar dehydrogenase [Enteractinococcus helveticum]|uniref:UDP-N-acetyl-D-glucosamine dehydrogenase n=1 Tax=Enteractinococcus helveticum TaxID=1837282 RepID=A0A1B7LUQ7_9MICC|nr:nucleotide sugar dehydrogenase [Enteractinococcus helveticum]OAV51193.1 UDP-N-acetyl-D-glucosamine dehydrogenase [Enteractinococcus helveticum]
MKDLVVIGQGYVGLPLSRAASNAGFNVTGLDVSQRIVDDLNAGKSHVEDIPAADLRQMLDNGYQATTDNTVIQNADVVVICVPTPLGDAGRPDLQAVESATKATAENLRRQTLVVLESTTYPGTTEELLLPALEANNRKLDQDFYLAFSPERIDPGNQTYRLENTPKVVGGVSSESGDLAVEFYSKFIEEVVKVKGAKEAETAKLLENTYRHINIGLVNEMAKFSHELGIDIWEVIKAAKTKPFGFQAFYPGPGVGGHCIPIDPSYLNYSVRKALGHPFRFVDLAEDINNSMPNYVVQRVQDLLNQHQKSLNGSKVLLLGVSYKANIADQRHSPAIPVGHGLADKGAVLSYHDANVPSWSLNGSTFESAENLDQAVQEADIVILLQAHKEYDLTDIASKAKLLFDTRGVADSEEAHVL